MKAVGNIRHFHFKTELSIEIEIISIAELYSGNRNILTLPHRCSFYHIIWVQKGRAMHHVDFTPVFLEPDSVLFVGKEMLHYFDRSAHYDGWVILFTEAFFSSTPEDIRFLRSSPVFNSLPDVSHIRIQPGDNPFSTLLRLMKEEQQRNPADKRQQRILKNLLYNFLLLAERKIKDGHPAFVRQSPEFDNILLFKDLLETNFLKEKSVLTWALMSRRILLNSLEDIPAKRPWNADWHSLPKPEAG